jgi:hypothetical protein
MEEFERVMTTLKYEVDQLEIVVQELKHTSRTRYVVPMQDVHKKKRSWKTKTLSKELF